MGNQFIEVKSPIDGALLGKVLVLSEEDIDDSMQKAKEALKYWSVTTTTKRISILYKAAELIERSRSELTELLVREIGKNKQRAGAEITQTIDLLHSIIRTVKSIEQENSRCYKNGRIESSHHVPIGLVLAIAPFNYPLYVGVSKIATALAMGNTVVFKPASESILSSLYLINIFYKAGTPEDVLHPVIGRGNRIGEYLVTHKAVNFISFSGSIETGYRISKVVSLVPHLMELRGKGSILVMEDADLDAAAKCIVAGAFAYSGQRFMLMKRVLVMNTVHDQLVVKILEYMKMLIVGNPLEINADVVPLVSTDSADCVWRSIQDTLKKGGELRTGGIRKDNLIYPTLIDKVTTNMPLAWEQPMGPVLPVITVNSIKEAVQMVNQEEYELKATLFTRDINQAHLISEQLKVETVQINGKIEGGPDHLPFLEVKSTGVGSQGLRSSMEAMTRLKSTVVNLTIEQKLYGGTR